MTTKLFHWCTIVALVMLLLTGCDKKEHTYIFKGVDFATKELAVEAAGGSFDVKFLAEGPVEFSNLSAGSDDVEYKHINGNLLEADWFKAELQKESLHITVEKNEGQARHGIIELRIVDDSFTTSFMSINQAGK